MQTLAVARWFDGLEVVVIVIFVALPFLGLRLGYEMCLLISLFGYSFLLTHFSSKGGKLIGKGNPFLYIGTLIGMIIVKVLVPLFPAFSIGIWMLIMLNRLNSSQSTQTSRL